MPEKHVFNVLSNPKSYDENIADVKVIKTLTSNVFLTGEYAYKTNRNIKLSFLDYSTKEKRIGFLKNEFEMNKQMTPELYLELLKIADGKIKKLDEEGVAEALVYKMKQVDPDSSMDKALKNNNVTTNHIIELAKIIAEFHKNAPIEKEYGTKEKVQDNWNSLFSYVDGGKDGFITKENFYFMKNKIDRFIENNTMLFSKRVDDNKIKFCHGDLHSANIFVGDKIMLFDRITFNKTFPCFDVIADVAFLAMDLEFNNKKEYKDLLIDEYIKNTTDHEGLKLLNFYLCYRAWVRGCINFFDNNPLGKEYFDLAEKYSRTF